MRYVRPLVQDHAKGAGFRLADGWAWFSDVEVLSRGAPARRMSARDLPEDVLERLCVKRPAIAGLSMAKPQIMGILNVTPDSFSDGGDSFATDTAVARADQMIRDGATIIDVGGESTRPGAAEVPVNEEINRILPVIKQLSGAVVSVDTRKAAVVEALPQGGNLQFLVNDVSAMRFDPRIGEVASRSDLPICLMHSVADPETMQQHARYDDVVLDVYDHLEERIALAVSLGIDRNRIIVDPGIGFGKTLEHNLALLRNLSLFHSLGCPILLGASRKRFIGTLGNAPDAKNRVGGSLSVALQGVRQGVQLLRVHDTFETKQAIDLHMAMNGTSKHDT